MEVKIDVVANTQNFLPELQKAKTEVTSLGNVAKTAGASFGTTFRSAASSVGAYERKVKDGIDAHLKLKPVVVETGNVIQKFGKDTQNVGEQGFVPLRKRIREATNELANLREQFDKGLVGSDAVAEAAQRLAELKKAQKELGEQADAFNPERKFTVFGQVLGGVRGGVESVVGAMGLFGGQSESVERALVRIQSAMVFTQGLNEILELGDSFKNLKLLILSAIGTKTVDTAVTQQNTVAAAENTVANTAEAGAITATGTAAGFAATAMAVLRAATAALLSPIGLVIAGVAALVGIFSLLDDSGEKYTAMLEDMERQSAKFEEENKQRETAQKNRIQNLNNELEQRRANGELQIQQMRNQNKSEKEIYEARKKLDEDLLEFRKRIAGQMAGDASYDLRTNLMQIETLRDKILQRIAAIKSGDLSKEQLQQYAEANDKDLERLKGLRDKNTQIIQETKNSNSEIAKANVEAKTEEAKNYKEFLDSQEAKLKAHNQRILEIEAEANQLRQRILNARLATTDNPDERMAIQNQLDEMELNALRESLIKQGQAREDAEAKDQNRKAKKYQLTKQQEDALTELAKLSEQKRAREREQIQIESAKQLLSLQMESEAKALAQFDLDWIERAKKLKAAGATDEQIEQERLTQRRLAQAKYQQDALSIEEQTQINIINARQRGKESEVQFETQKQIDILNVQLEFAKKRLALETALFAFNPTSERQKTIEGLNATIASIQTQIGKAQRSLLSSTSKISIAQLLGISGLSTEDEAEFNKQAQQIIANVQSIFSQILAEQQANVEASIQQNQSLIQSLDQRIQATQAAIDKETEAQRKGYANNVDAKKRELAQLQAEKQKAIDEEKRLNAERKKLAQEQAIIDSITQASQLISAGAILFGKEVAKGGALGVITAISAIAAMIASFLALKSKVSQATRFEKGGWIGGRRHSQGGNKYFSLDGDLMEHEAGEFVTNRSASKRHARVLEAINSGDMSNLSYIDIEPLLYGTGVSLRKDVEKRIVNQQIILNKREIKQSMGLNLGNVENRLTDIHKEVAGIKTEISSSQKTTVLPDGSTKVVKKEGDVEYVTIYKQK